MHFQQVNIASKRSASTNYQVPGMSIVIFLVNHLKRSRMLIAENVMQIF